MKILFLYMFPLWGNGSGSFLRELAVELIKDNHEVGIVAPDKRKLKGCHHFVPSPLKKAVFVGHPEWPDARKLEEMSAKEIVELQHSYLKTTLEAVEAFRPDVIHVFHTAFLPEIGRIVRVLKGLRFIITTHGSDLNYLVRDKRMIPFVADANTYARFVTANSDFTKKWYLQLFGQKIRRKTSVIVGGVRVEHFKQDPESIVEINKKFNLLGKKVVLFTGRLTKNKGVIHLLKAAHNIKAIVLIVGDGPERKTLEAEIQRLGLPNVVMAGYFNTENPLFHALYERADVYVSPSVWNEPLGLTILEAMASKTPVVATRKGGVVSIVNDGSNGFLISARNSKEIAYRVNMLLEDDQLRLRMGNAAYKTVVEKFSWDKIAIKFEKLYEDARQKGQAQEELPLDTFVKKLFALK